MLGTDRRPAGIRRPGAGRGPRGHRGVALRDPSWHALGDAPWPAGAPASRCGVGRDCVWVRSASFSPPGSAAPAAGTEPRALGLWTTDSAQTPAEGGPSATPRPPPLPPLAWLEVEKPKGAAGAGGRRLTFAGTAGATLSDARTVRSRRRWPARPVATRAARSGPAGSLGVAVPLLCGAEPGEASRVLRHCGRTMSPASCHITARR